MLNDRQIAQKLGHFDLAVKEGTDGRFYASCACKWKVRRELESAAVDDAVRHASTAAQRLRAEAARNGNTILEAIEAYQRRRFPTLGRR